MLCCRHFLVIANIFRVMGQTSLNKYSFVKVVHDVIDLTMDNIPLVQVSKSIEVETISYTDENKKRKCPFYKRIPGTTFTMDAFSFGEISGCTGYFLSHFHSDHFGGLRKKFNQKLYCSQITANLVKLRIGVDDEYIVPLPLNSPIDVQGITVTLIDANHCPGSVVFIFKVPASKINKTFASYRLTNIDLTIVHTGDFRAHPRMLDQMPKTVDFLFLDTTYLDPKHVFPDQSFVIRKISNIICDAIYNSGIESDFVRPVKKQKITKNQTRLSFGQALPPVVKAPKNPFIITAEDSILIAIGSYTIGKEKIALHLAKLLSSKIYLNAEKTKLWRTFMCDNVNKFMSDDINSQVHVLRMNEINYKFLDSYLEKTKYTKVIGISPTGWTFGSNEWAPSTVSKHILIYSIPYSEHSSYSELKDFTTRLNPVKVQPTVGMNKVPEQLELIKTWRPNKTKWEIENDLFLGKSIA